MAEELRMVRKLDELGRVVLPMETRRKLGWAFGDELEVIQNVELGEVKLRLKRKSGDLYCALCRAEPIDVVYSYLNEDTNMAICIDCVDKIRG